MGGWWDIVSLSMTLFSYLYIDTCVVCVWGSGWVDGGTCVVCVWGGGWVGGGTSYHPVTLYSYLHIDICVVCVWGGGWVWWVSGS